MIARSRRWGKNIRRNRESLGLTQNQLAEAVGVGQGTVANWEAGRIVPRDARRTAIAETLHVEVDDLFPIDGRGLQLEQEVLRLKTALREIVAHPKATAAIKQIARGALDEVGA